MPKNISTSALGRGQKAKVDFDVLIKGGTVYDGSLATPHVADIGIKGDKIIAVGDLTGTAEKTIDAKGYIVTPGFIDIHTHCDLSFKDTGALALLAFVVPEFKGNYNYTYQGVTTVVTGNCGYGFTNINRWLNFLNMVRFGTNVYHLAPHGAIRQELFGANQPSTLTSVQLEALKKKVAQEMEKGAVGVSYGLDYAPGCLVDNNELIELAKVAKDYGGIVTIHIRHMAGCRIVENGNALVIDAIKEAIDISRRVDIPVQISHLIIATTIEGLQASQFIHLIEDARKEGLDITSDQYPYDAGSTYIIVLLPKKYITDIGVKKEYQTPEGRAEIKSAIEQVFKIMGPEKIMISYCRQKKSCTGKTLREIADIENKSPADCFVELACVDKAPIGVLFQQDMKNVREVMTHDFVFTASDGFTNLRGLSKPHPRIYGTFTKKIRQFALDEKLIDLNATIRSMTSLPAEKFNIKNRGKITEGYFADVAIIDPLKISDKATYKQPDLFSEGIIYLLVNGVIEFKDGRPTGLTGGRALKRGQ